MEIKRIIIIGNYLISIYTLIYAQAQLRYLYNFL